MKSASITHLVLNNHCHKVLVIQMLAGLSSLKERLKSSDRGEVRGSGEVKCKLLLWT